jgi:hypothetical protein
VKWVAAVIIASPPILALSAVGAACFLALPFFAEAKAPTVPAAPGTAPDTLVGVPCRVIQFAAVRDSVYYEVNCRRGVILHGLPEPKPEANKR